MFIPSRGGALSLRYEVASDYEKFLFGELRSAREAVILDPNNTKPYEVVTEILSLGLRLYGFEQIWSYLETFGENERLYFKDGSTYRREDDIPLLLCAQLPPSLFQHVSRPNPEGIGYDAVSALFSKPYAVWVYLKGQCLTSRKVHSVWEIYQFERHYGKNFLTDVAALLFWHQSGWQKFRNPTETDLECLLQNIVVMPDHFERHPFRKKQCGGSWNLNWHKMKDHLQIKPVKEELQALEQIVIWNVPEQDPNGRGLGFHKEVEG
jgi:hypothetical protein